LWISICFVFFACLRFFRFIEKKYIHVFQRKKN
jgi:hypothetical protein